jgi:hypothetical protein
LNDGKLFFVVIRDLLIRGVRIWAVQTDLLRKERGSRFYPCSNVFSHQKERNENVDRSAPERERYVDVFSKMEGNNVNVSAKTSRCLRFLRHVFVSKEQLECPIGVKRLMRRSRHSMPDFSATLISW